MRELGLKGLPNNYGNEQFLKEGGAEMDEGTVQAGKQLYERLRSHMAEQARLSPEDTSLQAIMD